MIQLNCALTSGFNSPFIWADRKPSIRLFPSTEKLANSRTHCGSGPSGQSSGRSARAWASSTSGRRGVRFRQSSSAFSTAARDSRGGREHTVSRLGAPDFSSTCSGATLVTVVLYFSAVGVRNDLSTAGDSLGVGSLAGGCFAFLAQLPPSLDARAAPHSFTRLG